MSDTSHSETAANDRAAVTPQPEHAPDAHTRTRTIRADWWRTNTDPTHGADEHQPQPEERPEVPVPNDSSSERIEPDDEEREARRSFVERLRDHVTSDNTAGRSTAQPDEQSYEETDEPDEREPSRLERLRRHLTKDDTDVDDEEQDQDGEGGRWGSGKVLRRVPRQSAPAAREALFDWWSRRDTRQRFVLNNGAAAAFGAYTPGLMNAQWDTGLPQTVLAWMHDADATYGGPATPLVLGCGSVLAAAILGGFVAGFFLRFFQAVPTLCRVTHWLLVRVPVASAAVAVCLFTSN